MTWCVQYTLLSHISHEWAFSLSGCIHLISVLRKKNKKTSQLCTSCRQLQTHIVRTFAAGNKSVNASIQNIAEMCQTSSENRLQRGPSTQRVFSAHCLAHVQEAVTCKLMRTVSVTGYYSECIEDVSYVSIVTCANQSSLGWLPRCTHCWDTRMLPSDWVTAEPRGQRDNLSCATQSKQKLTYNQGFVRMQMCYLRN